MILKFGNLNDLQVFLAKLNYKNIGEETKEANVLYRGRYDYTSWIGMTFLDLQNDDGIATARKIYIVAFYLSATVMLVICFFGLYISLEQYLKTGKIVIGEVLVDTKFPLPGFGNLVTYLMIASVMSWFCVTKLVGDRLKDFPQSAKSI